MQLKTKWKVRPYVPVVMEVLVAALHYPEDEEVYETREEAVNRMMEMVGKKGNTRYSVEEICEEG